VGGGHSPLSACEFRSSVHPYCSSVFCLFCVIRRFPLTLRDGDPYRSIDVLGCSSGHVFLDTSPLSWSSCCSLFPRVPSLFPRSSTDVVQLPPWGMLSLFSLSSRRELASPLHNWTDPRPTCPRLPLLRASRPRAFFRLEDCFPPTPPDGPQLTSIPPNASRFPGKISVAFLHRCSFPKKVHA